MFAKLRKFWIIPFALFAAVLASCGEGSSSSSLSLTPEDLNTAQTDALKLDAAYTGKDFVADGVGEVYLKSCTDGDTANFYTEADHSVSIKLRFLGINTPESTGKVQPWGNAASAFTKSKLNDAQKVVLINDVSVFGLLDSSGGRYLGFVWYMPSDSTDFRLLNLELVELAYTQNLLYDASTVCPYLDAFQAAGEHAEACNAKIFGEEDPSFDYSGQIYDVSIRFVRASYGIETVLTDYDGNIVYTDDTNTTPVTVTLTNSTEIRIRAIVVGVIGNNLVLRDVSDPDPVSGDYASIYCFTQYRDAPFHKIGDIVQFYCKATTYNENVQLTDPELSTYSQKYPFQLIARDTNPNYQTIIEQNGFHADVNPIVINPANVTDSSYFSSRNGYYIQTNVTIRTGVNETPDELHGDYWTKDTSNNMTVYAYVAGTEVKMNLREDSGVYPYVNYTAFTASHTYTVAGYVAKYFDDYQLQILNGFTATEIV